MAHRRSPSMVQCDSEDETQDTQCGITMSQLGSDEEEEGGIPSDQSFFGTLSIIHLGVANN